ncbi:hypothetical protein X801_08066 [Opisthorchis viverrini]|uniref:SWIM-type domain-containing protein n=1 Tax=Opisthorchis viverrini TaxID=6198 RepID=A0A1S8WPF2_OPIVI|nr:hypothetical protein X801_08066 [Opisthorchis viverrini]
MTVVANCYIGSNLSQSSLLPDCVRSILKRSERVRNKFNMQVACGFKTAADKTLSKDLVLSLLNCPTPFAQNLALQNNNITLGVAESVSNWLKFSDDHLVRLDGRLKCTCSFSNRWPLTCRHMVKACWLSSDDSFKAELARLEKYTDELARVGVQQVPLPSFPDHEIKASDSSQPKPLLPNPPTNKSVVPLIQIPKFRN